MKTDIPLTLAMKLGSIAVHADELMSATGHPFDRTVLEGLISDPEVQAWVKGNGSVAPGKALVKVPGVAAETTRTSLLVQTRPRPRAGMRQPALLTESGRNVRPPEVAASATVGRGKGPRNFLKQEEI